MANRSGSSIAMIAGIVAAALAGAVGYAMFFPKADQSGLTTGSAAVEPAPSARPVASRPQPSPTPSATPTPVETPPPTATATATPEVETVSIAGIARSHDGGIVPGIEFFLVGRNRERATDSIREAFKNPESVLLATSGSEGTFTLTAEAGKPAIIGYMIAKQPQPGFMELDASAPGTAIPAEFTLPRPFELRGTVSDTSYARVSGIHLRLEWRPETVLSTVPSLQAMDLVTDNDGRFQAAQLSLSHLSITVIPELLPEAFIYTKGPVVLSSSDLKDVRAHRLDLEITKALTLEGVVLSAGGEEASPLTQASIRVVPVGANSDRSEFKTQTDAQGRFLVPRLAPSEYLITAWQDGYNTGTLQGYTLPADGPAKLSLHPLAVVDGIARVPADLKGRTASIHLVNRYSQRRMESRVNDDGTIPFSWPRTEPAQYLVFAEVEGPSVTWYGEQWITVTAEGTSTIKPMELTPLVEVSGNLIGTPPVEGYEALTIRADFREASPVPPEMEPRNASARRKPLVSTSTSGTYTLENLETGRAYLVTVVNRATGTPMGAGELVAGESKEMNIALVGVGHVAGRILNTRNEACPDVEVILTTGLGTVEGVTGDVQVRRTVSQFDGTYRFDSVPAGQARLSLNADYTTGRLISVPPSRTTSVDLQCRTWVSVAFDVKDSPEFPFKPGEQFLILPQPGTIILNPIREVTLEGLNLQLEPGNYTITRTTTMESRTFEVVPRLDGMMTIDFTRPKTPGEASDLPPATPSPVPTPIPGPGGATPVFQRISE